MPSRESDVRDARAWAARELQKQAEKNGKHLKREEAERIVRDSHKLDEKKESGR